MQQKKPNKFQNVTFLSIEEFLEYLPDDERIIVERLRKIIFSTIPAIHEKLSYNVPYFALNRNICFIWPSSIPWGNVRTKGVRFGFTNGHLLSNLDGYLEKAHRKQVCWRDLYLVQDINIEIIRSLLIEAALLDEEREAIRNNKR